MNEETHDEPFARYPSEDRMRKAIGHRRLGTSFDALEGRQLLAAILNGDFAISDPTDPNFGWALRGDATVAQDEGLLNEGTTDNSRFSQTFTIPQGTTTLRFVIITSNLLNNGSGSPPDVFQASLVNAQTNEPMVGPPPELSDTDAFLNVQQAGEVYYVPQVTVPGAGPSGSVASLIFPEVISVDLSSVPANTQAILSFQLFGSDPATSFIGIDDVTSLQGPTPPPVAVILDPTADSGAPFDSLTRVNPVDLIGVSDPNQAVMLDIDDNGFDDRESTADASGHFKFTGVNLVEGSNTVRVQATNAQGSTIATRIITIDTQPPTGILVSPFPNSTPSQDLGYVDVQWTDQGTAGIDPRTFNIGNVTITGVTVDRVLDLGNNRERYFYDDEGDTLTAGLINVVLAPGQVADRAANTNAQATQSFTFQPHTTYAPTANAQSVTTSQETAKAITLTGFDPNNPPLTLTYTVITNPAHGKLSGTAPDLIYTPATGFSGPDSFECKVNNGTLDSTAATISITVMARITPPVSIDDTYTTVQNRPLSVAAPGVLANDRFPGLAPIAVLVAGPTHGSLTFSGDGSYSYIPGANYFGSDTFTYMAIAGTGAGTRRWSI